MSDVGCQMLVALMKQRSVGSGQIKHPNSGSRFVMRGAEAANHGDSSNVRLFRPAGAVRG